MSATPHEVHEIPGHPGWHGWESMDGGKPSGHLYASTAHNCCGWDVCSGTTVDANSPEELDKKIAAAEKERGRYAA